VGISIGEKVDELSVVGDKMVVVAGGGVEVGGGNSRVALARIGGVGSIAGGGGAKLLQVNR
jgi:hypothetical protein